MKKIIQIVLCFSFVLGLKAQDGDLNMTIVAHVPAPEGASGVWHYVDKKHKTEYAILGSRTATVLYSLEDPTKPKERFRFTGATTTWREVFSYGEFVYAVTDNATDGLAIIDMRKAPDTITGKFWKPSLTAGTQTAVLSNCHTLFVDEKGILSLNGCGPWSGILFFDIKTDPMNPKYIGSELKRYCHDDFVRGDTLYSSEIYEGFVSIYDVKDYKNPKELVNIKTPFAFTHNSWISDDSKYIFTTDEREEATVASFDISDFSKVKLLDTWKPKDTEGKGVIPHNIRYHNGYLITAYYTDGVKILDAHRPDNLVEVGSYDTYLTGNPGGFYGTWGVSPFLPSGLIVASNIEDGLFIIRPNYIRACYLEGLVTDTITGLPINNVNVVITTPRKNYDNTDLSGNYKTGYANAGTFKVVFTHPDYFPKTVDAILINGQVTIKDVQLVSRRPSITAKIIVRDSLTNQIIKGASIRLFNVNGDKAAITGADGSASFYIFQDTIAYDLVVGKWGFLHKGIKFESDKQAPFIEVKLRRGYQDDFIFDQGWSINSTASSGLWIRANPVGTIYRNEQLQTDKDIQNDFGLECFVTGNTGTEPSGDDVDNGATTLLSPVFKIANYKEPILNFYYWFTNAGGQGTPNDKMTIRITNGFTTAIIKEISTHDPRWNFSDSIKLKGLIAITDSMRLIVDIADEVPGHLLEGGFDDFLIYDAIITSNEDRHSNVEMKVVPSIFNHTTLVKFNLSGTISHATIDVLDINSKLIQSQKLHSNHGSIEIGEELVQGIYFVKITDQEGHSAVEKIVKQ
ncbi:MAG: choice-of-anchor B family protein [Saprospiraceae bacterium]